MSLSPDRLESLPTEPGVYLFKDARGRVLYVGKAKSLKSRVKQYFSGHDGRVMVPFLVRAAADLDVVVVRTEKEALILENTLIKKHLPRYNTQLIDDTNFLHLRIDPNGEWPRYALTRGIGDKRFRHFGPYTSAARARATLEYLGRSFPLRTCTDREMRSRSRPCILHQMRRCLAPCVGLCTKEAYDEALQQSMLFLEGRNKELLDRLGERMAATAEREEYEEAARLRDLIRAISATTERQQVLDIRQRDRDAWGVYREGDSGVLTLLPVRQGRLQEAVNLSFENVVEEDGDLLSSALNHWYQPGAVFPAEILLSAEPPDQEALTELLAERAAEEPGRSAPRLLVPQRGDKHDLVALAVQNAKSHHARLAASKDRSTRALDELAAACHLPRPPRRIECFDNSNIQGTDPVAAMVVFIDGKPARAEYRRYRVKTVVGADDFASMREILSRRISRALQDGVFPDLLVVDGGKGQLSAALAVLEDLGVRDLPCIGLVKPRTEHAHGDRDATDKIVLPGVKNPIALRHNSAALHLLQAVRDETHNTAVQYHRKVRTRRNLASRLESLPGVGRIRSRALLKHFGSAAALGRATAEEIAALPGFGPALAEQIVAALAEGAKPPRAS